MGENFQKAKFIQPIKIFITCPDDLRLPDTTANILHRFQWSKGNINYMEAVHKELFGNDVLQVAVQMENGQFIGPIGEEYLYFYYKSSGGSKLWYFVLGKGSTYLSNWVSQPASVYTGVSSTLMTWSNVNKTELHAWQFEKREFTWKFHQLLCPGQTRTKVAWELTSESLRESFINFHVLVKREQELHESWRERERESWHAWEFHKLTSPDGKLYIV